MADHPWSCSREALSPTTGSVHQPRRLAGTTAAPRTVRGLVLADRLRCVGATLIGCVRFPRGSRHAGEIGSRQNHARSFHLTARAILRFVTFRHRSHVGERPAIVTEIFVDRHLLSSRGYLRDCGCGAADTHRPASRRAGISYLSCESGIWMSPLICLIGPADDGMMSKSKISVGSHSVAQALGTSTTPEI
jgi:hypothetical protein